MSDMQSCKSLQLTGATFGLLIFLVIIVTFDHWYHTYQFISKYLISLWYQTCSSLPGIFSVQISPWSSFEPFCCFWWPKSVTPLISASAKSRDLILRLTYMLGYGGLHLGQGNSTKLVVEAARASSILATQQWPELTHWHHFDIFMNLKNKFLLEWKYTFCITNLKLRRLNILQDPAQKILYLTFFHNLECFLHEVL